jgi:hypothetical protein
VSRYHQENIVRSNNESELSRRARHARGWDERRPGCLLALYRRTIGTCWRRSRGSLGLGARDDDRAHRRSAAPGVGTAAGPARRRIRYRCYSAAGDCVLPEGMFCRDSVASRASCHCEIIEGHGCQQVREGVGCIQCGPDKLSISPAQHSISIVDGEPETGALVSTGVRIAGADHTSQHVVVWSGKKAEVYEITSQQSCRYVCAFAKDTALIAIKGQTLFCLCGARVEVCNLQGTVKSTLAFTDAEGAPTTFDVMGSFLVVATAHGFIKMWDISRREPRQHGAGKLFVGNDAPADAAQCPLGAIEAVRVNANGSRVAVLATKSNSGSSTPDSKLHVWFVDLDKIENFDFAPVGRRPVSTFWDPVEPRLLACDTVSLHKGGQNSGEARNVMTLFVTPEPSVILQDTVVPEKGHQAFMGIQVPSLFFAYKHPDGDSWQASDKVDGATLQPWTLRDFSGMYIVPFFVVLVM